MSQPKIVMNAAAWYEIMSRTLTGEMKFKETEKGFLLGNIPITIVPYFKEEQIHDDDPTGYPV